MKPLKTETDMFFARMASAIERENYAAGIADTLAGSTQEERDKLRNEWNQKADSVEAKLAEALRQAVKAHDDIVASNLPPMVKASFSALFNAESAREVLAKAEGRKP